MSDKRKLYIISASTPAALLLAFVLSGEFSGKIVAAALMLPVALLCGFLIKKRGIPSINKPQVLMLLSAISLVLLSLLYLSGLKFGFVKNPYALQPRFLLTYALPMLVAIGASEYFRHVMRAQDDKWADALSYVTCVAAEMLMFGSFTYLTSFNRFMDFVGMALFPAITANLLYHYISKRYGMYPNIVYRVVTTLYVYFIPFESRIPDSLVALLKLLIPVLIFFFIDALYEKKRKYALAKKSKLSAVVSVVLLAMAIPVIMLISNQFRYGLLIVATPSMTGELNQGDAAIFQRIDDQPIQEGQVIVFEKNNSLVIHRVADIQTINGTTRYYTKGDANEDLDAGYITRADVIGFVNHKIPYIGYPTIWMRSLFKR